MTIALVRASVAACFLAAFGLCVVFWTYVPINVDGGWYAYPALAMSQGRDPGENQAPIERLLNEKSGIKAHFEWDTRRSLLVLPMAAWFSAAGHDLVASRAYAIVEYATLLILFYVLAIRLSARNRILSLAATALLATDIKLVNAGLADLRPDMALAILTFVILLVFESDLKHWTVLKLVAAIVAALALPLAHLTAPIVLGFITVFCVVRSYYAPNVNRIVFAMSIFLCMALAFLFRSPMLDILVPTNVDETYHFNLDERVAGILDKGLLAKMEIELVRWADYFLVSNAVHAIVIIAALLFAVRAIILRRVDRRSPLFAFAIAIPFPIATVFLFDSYARADHIIPLVSLLMLLPVLVCPLAFERAGTPVGSRGAIIAVLLACAGLKIFHAGALAHRFEDLQMSNEGIRQALATVTGRRTHTLIHGPVEIWPYLPEDANVLIVDERNKLVARTADEWLAFDVVVLNADVVGYRWPDRFLQANPWFKLVPTNEIGDPATEYYLGVFSIDASRPSDSSADSALQY